MPDILITVTQCGEGGYWCTDLIEQTEASRDFLIESLPKHQQTYILTYQYDHVTVVSPHVDSRLVVELD